MADMKMPDNIWEQLFVQTPAIFRYVMGVLTLGIFTLASVLYKWHRDDLRHLSERMEAMDVRHNERTNRLEKVMDARHHETNQILMQIATNTRQSAQASDSSSGDQ